jgi:hypothetical protein
LSVVIRVCLRRLSYQTSAWLSSSVLLVCIDAVYGMSTKTCSLTSRQGYQSGSATNTKHLDTGKRLQCNCVNKRNAGTTTAIVYGVDRHPCLCGFLPFLLCLASHVFDGSLEALIVIVQLAIALANGHRLQHRSTECLEVFVASDWELWALPSDCAAVAASKVVCKEGNSKDQPSD